MKIQRIEIKNLFDQFDYDIPLTNPEDLLILTAPNGFGKTMILNIIDSLFNRKFDFFHKLVFDKITLWLENDIYIQINKQENNSEVNFILYEKNEKIDTFLLTSENADAEIRKISKFKIIMSDFFDETSETTMSDTLLEFQKSHPKLSRILSNTNVYLIKEQRLFRRPIQKRNALFSEENGYMNYSIQEYAKELKSSIAAIIQKSFRVSQDLDSSFPKRLLNETVKITEKEFNSRFEILRQKQAKLKEFGLSESEQEIPTYDETNAKVLLVYLSDTEKKVGVFDELIQHLELFTNILNQRRFTFKTIQINKEKGFHFVTNKGKELSLTDLSSGEQHEVVLLYELIFKTTPNTVVLIDEPEISLHVTWQKEFLRDLLAIIQLQQLQVIVATHSPSIIHDRWDLVFNLQTQEMQ